MWKQSEIDFLCENYPQMSFAEIGAAIGRTKGAVQRKHSRMICDPDRHKSAERRPYRKRNDMLRGPKIIEGQNVIQLRRIGGCQYPVGNGYCGARSIGRYCEQHARSAFPRDMTPIAGQDDGRYKSSRYF